MAMIPGWVYRPRAAVRAGIRPLLLLGVAAIGCVTPAAASGNVAVELVSRCEGEFWGVAVSGNYAYAVGGTELRILDVSNPAAPLCVGSCSCLFDAMEVTIQSGYAYVADYAMGLVIIDVSDPEAPELVWEDSESTPGGYLDVAVSNGYACLASTEEPLGIWDVSNPAAAQRVGWYPPFSRGLGVSGDYVYLANYSCGSEAGLDVVDMSEPATPQHVGCCSLGLGGEAWDVELSGGYAYVADGEAGLGIVDVTNPAAPVLVGTGEMSGYGGWMWSVAVTGNYAFTGICNGHTSMNLQIFDVSEPEAPVVVAVSGTCDGYWLSCARAVGGYVYAADAAGLTIFRVHGMKGDLDDDGQVAASDLPLFIDVLLGGSSDPAHIQAADMNSSGVADGLDVQLFVRAVVNG